MKLCLCCGERERRIKWCEECATKLFKDMQRRYTLARWLRTRPKGPCANCGKTLERGQRKWCLSCTIPQRKRAKWARMKRQAA